LIGLKRVLIIANTREEFDNESEWSRSAYNDHPSEQSIRMVVRELTEYGWEVEYFGGTKELLKACTHAEDFSDAIFLNLSDGMNQSSRKAQSAILLEILNAMYAGSEPFARLLAGNKYYSKLRVSQEGILVPKGFLCNARQVPNMVFENYPLVVKPNREGSSLGITQKNICNSFVEIQECIKSLRKFEELLIEEYVEGFEVTVFLIGNPGSFPVSEVILGSYNGEYYFSEFLFGLEEKSNGRRQQVLADHILPQMLLDLAIETGKRVFSALGARDFARIDFRLTKNNELYFLEMNGNPVISETSELGIACKERKYNMGHYVSEIVLSAIDRLSHK
jgi:D-alanine-D-alanine ligase